MAGTGRPVLGGVVALACLALPAAAPAFDNQLDGLFRVRGILAELSRQDDRRPDRLVDQRFRARWTLGLNEYVRIVYHAEVDFQYGDSAYGLAADGENEGGGLGGDTANLETKGAYLDTDIPNSPLGLRLGLQPVADRWNQAFVAGDMAGFTGTLGREAWKVAAGWYKWQEGAGSVEDDIDLWLTQVDIALSARAALTLDGYYLNANGAADGTNRAFEYGPVAGDLGAADLYYLGLGGSYGGDEWSTSGWFALNDGSYDSMALGQEVKVSSWAATARAEYTPAGRGARYALRLIYQPGDDDVGDDRAHFFAAPAQPTGQYPFAQDGFLIMLADAHGDTYSQPGFAMTDGAFAGNGLWAATLSAGYVPPTRTNLFLKGSLGYFSTVTGEDNGARGDGLGTELALRFGYRMADYVELSLNAAYAWLGSFYDDSAAAGADPDNPYALYFMVAVPY